MLLSAEGDDDVEGVAVDADGVDVGKDVHRRNDNGYHCPAVTLAFSALVVGEMYLPVFVVR